MGSTDSVGITAAGAGVITLTACARSRALASFTARSTACPIGLCAVTTTYEPTGRGPGFGFTTPSFSFSSPNAPSPDRIIRHVSSCHTASDADRHSGASLFCSAASGRRHLQEEFVPFTAANKIDAVDFPHASRSYPTARTLARSPIDRNESPACTPSHPARRYPSTTSATWSSVGELSAVIGSASVVFRVQSTGMNSFCVSRSSAAHPTRSPRCTQLGAPNAAASTTVMPYASYAHGCTFRHVRRYIRSIPSASRKSLHTSL